MIVEETWIEVTTDLDFNFDRYTFTLRLLCDNLGQENQALNVRGEFNAVLHHSMGTLRLSDTMHHKDSAAIIDLRRYDTANPAAIERHVRPLLLHHLLHRYARAELSIKHKASDGSTTGVVVSYRH